MSMKHYDGEFGVFDYDDTEFRIDSYRHLRYIGKETDGSKIDIPDGITSCVSMFYKNKNLKTAPRIPLSVIDCAGMFEGCTGLKVPPVIPYGVEDCICMLQDCKSLKQAPVIPAMVIDYSGMFNGCSDTIQKAGEWNLRYRGENYGVEDIDVNIYKKSLPRRTKKSLRDAIGVETVNQDLQDSFD